MRSCHHLFLGCHLFLSWCPILTRMSISTISALCNIKMLLITRSGQNRIVVLLSNIYGVVIPFVSLRQTSKESCVHNIERADNSLTLGKNIIKTVCRRRGGGGLGMDSMEEIMSITINFPYKKANFKSRSSDISHITYWKSR